MFVVIFAFTELPLFLMLLDKHATNIPENRKKRRISLLSSWLVLGENETGSICKA